MPQALLLMIVTIFVSALILSIKWAKNNERKMKNIAQKHEKSFKSAEKIEDLIALYLDMVLTHGPNSREAKSFRFGVSNNELLGGNDALKSFLALAGVIDDTVRKNKNCKN